MVNNNRIAKNTIFLYIRMAFSMVVSLYTVRVVLQVLGIEDYGIYSAVGGIVSTLTIFTGTLAIASQRFFSIEIGKNSIEGLNRIFCTIFTIYLIAGIFILIISETIGVWFLNNKMIIPYDRLEAAMVLLQCTIVIFIISIIISPFQSLIIAKEDMKIYAYVGVYDVVIKLFIVYLLQIFNKDKLVIYGILLLFASISSNIIYLIYSIKNYSSISFRIRWNLTEVKNILGFSSWSFVGALAFLFNTQGLNILMNVFYGPIVNASYNIGNSVKNVVNQFGTNFYVAVRPAMIKEYSANNYEYVRKLFFFSTKILFSLLFVIIYPIIIETNGILVLWLDKVDGYMVSFVRLMLIWALILNLSDPITTIVQAANKVKRYHIFVDVFTLLTLPLSFIVFKYFNASPNSSLIISIIIFIIAHFIRLVVLKNIMNIGIWIYIKKIIFKLIQTIFVTSIIAVFINTFFPSSGLFSLFVRIIIEILIALIFCYVILLDKEERLLIKVMIINRRKKC